MVYVQHIPSPPLNRYIEYLYYLDGWMPFRHEKILPVPALDLKINLGSDFNMYDRGRSTSPTRTPQPASPSVKVGQRDVTVFRRV